MPLAGRELLPREVAKLCYEARWTDVEKLITVVAIVYAESAGYTEAVGGPNPDGSYDSGLFQLNSIHGVPKADAFDPVKAAAFARKLYVNAGYSFRPWAAYTNGAYKRHLVRAVNGVCNAQKERFGLPLIH